LDHGLGVGYFFQTGLTEKLLEKNVRLVFLLQEAELERRKLKPAHPNMIFESMREKETLNYQKSYYAGMQELFEFVRRTITSTKISLSYVNVRQRNKEFEAKGRRKNVLKTLRPLIYILRRTKSGRALFLKLQCGLFTTNIYSDLFDKFRPSLVISDSAGWRLDQYLLREANRRKIKTATVIVGWDNPGSTGMPGAHVDYVNVWSAVHERELADGVDWKRKNIFIGGMPLYDGYINKQWLMCRDSYFDLHKLDPNKKLISFAATALSATPNLPTIKILADLVHNQKLNQPAQLLVRLHPTHFKSDPAYKKEAQQIFALAEEYRDVHIVEPKATPGGLERYSGEDFPEKASMLAYSDVLITIYSTMVVEGALHDTPCINTVIPVVDGWENKFWVPMEEIPSWPTPVRIDQAGTGKSVSTIEALVAALNAYFADSALDHEGRMKFIRNEMTFLDGTATQKTAENLAHIIDFS
jgi:CDP-glycerol glycerophosphotransferase (TagB/SpsB family)